jgi:hypothetical protein
VSADPSLHEECFKGAKFLLRLLESIGCEVKLSQVGRQTACSMYACPDQPTPGLGSALAALARCLAPLAAAAVEMSCPVSHHLPF